MSTIDSGVLGIVQGQAPSKGKTGQGKAEGASEKGDFANTIANLHGREGEGGRKGSRVSISGTAHAEINSEEAGDTRTKAGHRDIAALAEALRKASADVSGEDKTPLDEEAASPHDAANRSERKVRAAERDGGKLDKQNDAGLAVDDDATVDEASAARTDVGNLLAMLAAPATTPNTVSADRALNGAGADLAQEVAAQVGGKASAKADAAAVKADASHADDGADSGDMPASDADQLFRLIRADGKGRDVDMRISGDGERATARDANPTGPKGETVTVVDARRYIGLAQTSNSAAVTSAIAQDPQWASSLGSTGGLSHSEAALTGKVVNTLKIQMHPIDLGLVTATLRLHGDDLVVSLQVQTGDAYRQLSEDRDKIVKALRDQGFAVDQISVQLSPSDKSANAQQGDGSAQPQSQSNQPQAREGSNGRQGSGEQATRNPGREDASHEGNTSENAAGLAGGQSVRSGGVYL